MNLFHVLKSDLKNRQLQLSKYEDILNLRFLAQNRKNWQEMFDQYWLIKSDDNDHEISNSALFHTMKI